MKFKNNTIKEVKEIINECPFCQTSIPEVHCRVDIEEIGFKYKNKQRPDYKKNYKLYDFEHWCSGCGRALGMNKIT